MKHKELHLLSLEIASAELMDASILYFSLLLIGLQLCHFINIQACSSFLLQTVTGCKIMRLKLGYLAHNNKYQKAQKWTVLSMAAALEYVISLWNY
jgi:hypothetical protein